MLDDIWQADHERQLNFLEVTTVPESKVFVTSRFAKLLPGYVEVALGLLSEDEGVRLLLGSAEITETTQLQQDAARAICKLAGFLVSGQGRVRSGVRQG